MNPVTWGLVIMGGCFIWKAYISSLNFESIVIMGFGIIILALAGIFHELDRE